MNADRLAEVQKLCDDATPGPWEWCPHDGSMTTLDPANDWANHVLLCRGCPPCLERGRICGAPSLHDANFIATARAALPECLAHILELQAEIESLKAALEATGQAMNVLGIVERQCKIQRAVDIFNANPTGPAAGMMHKVLTEGDVP